MWPRGSIAYEVLRFVLFAWFKMVGWNVADPLPKGKKFVIIAAPHTSNWDFPFMLAAAMHWRVPVRWLGKDAIFKPAFIGVIARKLGGIAVDRSKNNNVVDGLVKEFGERDEFILMVPPEGTRAKTKYWKTGFYHIAHGADVPIALGFLDYEKKLAGFGGSFKTTGDYDADLVDIKAFYNGVKGKYPEQGEAR